MNIKDKIKGLFLEVNELSIKEIADSLLVSKQAIHYAVNQLLSENFLEKLGRTPKTIYRKIKENSTRSEVALPVIPDEENAFLKRNFLLITETGTMLEGLEGFDKWCKQRNLPLLKTLKEYVFTKEKYDSYIEKNGLINGMNKLKTTKGYEHIWLDDLYYVDFYAIERFGKTRLGTLLHYAKQGQNKMLMKILVDEVRNKIQKFLEEKKADAVAFVPPTIRREVQIMRFIETQLKISLPVIKVNKISGIIPVPQKSLNKLEERIRNAENTFSITENNRYNNVVLIDDAVGSGSTLNEIAGKIKNKKIAQQITGLAIVGSFKGFDVITDV